MILCKASADCSDGSQVFETRKASAKEASVNLEQVLCCRSWCFVCVAAAGALCVATAGAVTAMQVVPSVETGFAGTALHCHD